MLRYAVPTAAIVVAGLAASPAAALIPPPVPPTVAFTSAPVDGARTNAAELTFAATPGDADVDLYTCVVDGQAQECWESLSLTDLADGAHTVSVTATDEDGDTSAPITSTFTRDATGPAPTLATLPGTLPAGPIALSGTAGSAAFDDATIDVLVIPYVEGMQHSLDPVSVQKVPVVDGRWSITTAAIPAGSYFVAVDQFDDLFNYGHASQQVKVVAPAPAPAPAPAATPAPAPAPVVPAPKPVDPKTALAQTARGLTRSLTEGGIAGLLKQPTVASFQAPSAGTVTVTYRAPRAKGAKGKAVVIATGTKTVGAAGQAKVRVTLTKAGRSALAKGTRVKLTVETSFKAKGAKTAQTSTSKVTLKRK